MDQSSGRLKVNFPFWIVLVAGLATFALKCKVTYSVQCSYFYSPLQYPEINHPDAHYPPLYSLLTVPFYLTFGKTAAVKLPVMLVSSAANLSVFTYKGWEEGTYSLYWDVDRLSLG